MAPRNSRVQPTKRLIQSYDLFGILKMRIHYHAKAANLARMLDRFKCEDLKAAHLDLVLCRSKQQVPNASQTLTDGCYKLIPWVLSRRSANGASDGEVFFWAPYFLTFLVLRIVLTPYFKREVVKQGGFSFIGSVFSRNGSTYLVTGRPGLGKTHILLKALEQDALFLSDNEIFVTRNSTIQSLFDEVELRFETVRHTQFWSKLRPEQQWALHLYRWISLVTRRKICFGLSVAPQELGISSTQLVNMNNPRFYLLDDVEVPGVMELKHVLQSSLNYEHWYASLFGDLFMTEDFQVRNAEKLSQFLNGKPCWRYPPSELVRQLTPDLHHDQSAA